MHPPVLLRLSLLGTSVLLGCQNKYADLPTFSTERKLLQMVVEMPAGTSHVQHYNAANNELERSQQAGSDELIEFLPVPGNLGFIPSTRSPGHEPVPAVPLPTLVLAESQPAGTVLEVLPVALLTLDVNGTLQNVLLSVPARPAQRILPDATDWATLNRRYPGVRASLSLWFQHRTAQTRIVGWKDEKAAEKEVRNWMQ